MLTIDRVLEEVQRLPEDWHIGGTVTSATLQAIVKNVADLDVSHSMETGSGRTTLLFSHLSRDHKVFAVNDYGDTDTKSITAVQASPLFNGTTVEFIEGPTQRTLPQYQFKHAFQVACIDGPHGFPFPAIEYYYIYPHLEENALLILDDIHIPTIRHMFDFLKEDEMFALIEVVDTTAFFKRTSAPTFDPFLDGWWLQAYNKKRFPVAVG
jgi:Methyltransferase domain